MAMGSGGGGIEAQVGMPRLGAAILKAGWSGWFLALISLKDPPEIRLAPIQKRARQKLPKFYVKRGTKD